MVAPATPKKPILLLKLFLDQGLQRLAGKTLDFKSEHYIAKVLNWAIIDKSIPCPPGQIQISDASITLADVDNEIRALFDDTTPLRRLGQIIFDDENNLGVLADPVYTGEIEPGVEFPTGQVTIPLRDVTAAWLERKIPNLLIRDNFPNLPDYIELGFIPIIFGVCQSFTESGVEPQGVIKCWECDTTLNRYVVARHRCHSITTVYRKLTKLNALFRPVSPSEYTVITVPMTLNGIDYIMTMLQFHSPQPYGTEIHADVEGIDIRYDFLTNAWVDTPDASRNPADCLVILSEYLLEDEINIQRYDSNSFIDTIQRCTDKHYTADGAITEQVTAGEAVSKLASDFDIDFFQTSHGKIKVHLYDPELDANDVVLVNDRFVERQTFTPSLNKEIYNRFRFRYFRQNALLTEYVKSSNTGQWGREDLIDYIPDQEELGATGENPILEKEIDLFFIRDSNVAFNVIKRRIGYYTLRSYVAQFNLPLPEFTELDLTQLLSITHFAGVSITGWENKILKTYRITQNLQTWRAIIEAVFIAPISDADLSFNGGAPAHDPQIIYPQLGLVVGDGNNYLNYPNSDPQGLLSDTYPAPPSSGSDDEGTVPSSFSFTSTGGSTRSVPVSRLSFVNVRFQEDRTTSPRSISGYVPIPSLLHDVEFYNGTLFPDQRPTGLATSDIYKVMFYSTDFDHLYWYVGTGESGTPSGWRAVEQSAGNIYLRWDNPVMPGYHKADGSSVRMSDYQGNTSVVTLPNLYPGTNTADALLGVGASPVISATPSLTENVTLPACLGATGLVIDEAILVPWMRL